MARNFVDMNIYLTVGTQLPFDRLVRAVDDWAGGARAQVIGQIGRSELQPKNMRWQHFFDAAESDRHIRSADLVVAHAGMGTILTRLEEGLPLLIMARRAAFGEHRNDHQVATAARLAHLPCITVVEDERALQAALSEFRPSGANQSIGRTASPVLLRKVRDFVMKGPR